MVLEVLCYRKEVWLVRGDWFSGFRSLVLLTFSLSFPLVSQIDWKVWDDRCWKTGNSYFLGWFGFSVALHSSPLHSVWDLHWHSSFILCLVQTLNMHQGDSLPFVFVALQKYISLATSLFVSCPPQHLCLVKHIDLFSNLSIDFEFPIFGSLDIKNCFKYHFQNLNDQLKTLKETMFISQNVFSNLWEGVERES